MPQLRNQGPIADARSIFQGHVTRHTSPLFNCLT